jgi:hypothetical protein
MLWENMKDIKINKEWKECKKFIYLIIFIRKILINCLKYAIKLDSSINYYVFYVFLILSFIWLGTF